MRLIPSDPDVETIVSRIRSVDLDLQPNFQRGEVWSIGKKQRLIDSILRDWHVPPIHVIQGGDGTPDVVLDGQQRLAAIRDFVEGSLKVDGNIEPRDVRIAKLHGMRFHELPSDWKRKVNRFAIRQFTIVDFDPSEPSELFYRLNQPVALTAAEQRNSFFGKPREQIKNLVVQMEQGGINKEFLGFSNARMSYDDALARVCVALEEGLAKKTGANVLADRYRSGEPFGIKALELAQSSIDVLIAARQAGSTLGYRITKAGLFSWLIFFARARHQHGISKQDLAVFFLQLEEVRAEITRSWDIENVRIAGHEAGTPLLEIYNDRLKSRVADVSSVYLRDLAIWGIYLMLPGSKKYRDFDGYSTFWDFLEEYRGKTNESLLLRYLDLCGHQWERVV